MENILAPKYESTSITFFQLLKAVGDCANDKVNEKTVVLDKVEERHPNA